MKSSTVPPGPGRMSIDKKLAKGHSEVGNDKYQEENILNLLDLPIMCVNASGMISTAGDLAIWIYSLHSR